MRVKQKRAEEAKRAQERAAKRALDEAEFAEAGDESGPIDLTSEGDRFDFTGDRFDSPPSSPLHRARDDRPGNPSPGKGIRASAAPLDPNAWRPKPPAATETTAPPCAARKSTLATVVQRSLNFSLSGFTGPIRTRILVPAPRARAP